MYLFIILYLLWLTFPNTQDNFCNFWKHEKYDWRCWSLSTMLIYSQYYIKYQQNIQYNCRYKCRTGVCKWCRSRSEIPNTFFWCSHTWQICSLLLCIPNPSVFRSSWLSHDSICNCQGVSVNDHTILFVVRPIWPEWFITLQSYREDVCWELYPWLKLLLNILAYTQFLSAVVMTCPALTTI